MTPVVDPFMQGHEPPTRRPGDFYRDKQGTPYVTVPDGHFVKRKRKGDPDRIATTPYSRSSNFGKLIEDMYSIHKWDQRQQVYGFAVAPDLVDRARVLLDIEDRESQQWKDEADKIAKAAKIAAKSSIAADRGSQAHSLAEDDDEGRDIITRIEAGEALGLSAEVQHSLVAAWRGMLERDGLEILAVEMTVVNDTYRAAGTLDRVARLTRPLKFRLITGELIEVAAGTVVILDIKSGKRRLRSNGTVMYWHGYAVQVFLYGPTSLPYDTETDTRGEWQWEVDGRWALIAHLDVLGAIDGNPSCDLILVDLQAGRRAADLCVAAKAWANDATVFSVAQIAGEGAADSSPPPSPADHDCAEQRCEELGEQFAADWFTPDPARLALVQARDTLAARPDEGADLAGAEHGEQWAALQRHYGDLDAAAKSWLADLIGEATRRGVDFHARRNKTLRVFELYRALIALCAADGGTDELLRALLALVIGDVALMPGVHPGHAVGSLSAAEATRLADLVDRFNGPGLAAYIDEQQIFRLREVSPA